MKKIFFTLTAAGLVAAGITSCKKVKDALAPTFEITVPTTQVTVPSLEANATSNLQGSVAFDADAAIKSYSSNFGLNNVASIKLLNVTLTKTNITNYSNVKVKMNNSAYVINSELADQSTNQVVINGLDVELKSLLSGSSINYNIEAKARRAVTAGSMGVGAVLLVKAQL